MSVPTSRHYILEVNEWIYLQGIRLMVLLQSLPFLNDAATAFSRVWLRHQKLRRFLVSRQFDGVIDGGANVGEFAQMVRSALPDADLICVEPHAPSAAILRRKGFNVVEAALWKERTRLKLTQPTTATTSCTVIGSDSEPGQNFWEVEAIRLEDLAISGRNIFLKLDLQGAEMDALEGMGELWKKCTALMLEVSIGKSGNYESLRTFLAGEGFAEYSTTNELEEAGNVVEADKIWLRESSPVA